MSKSRDIKRPKSSAVKASIKRITELDKTVQSILQSKSVTENNTKLAVKEMQKKSLEKTLEKIDIEKINEGKQGIRIATLRQNGINNVWQAYKTNTSSLIKIPGISNESAYKIKKLVNEIAQASFTNGEIRLDIDDNSRQAKNLIDNLYLILNCREYWDLSAQLDNSYHKPIIKAVNSAKHAKGVLSWFFTSDKIREESVNDIGFIDNILSGPYPGLVSACNEKFKAVSSTLSTERRKDFESRPASYIAILESFAPTAKATSGIENALPSELIAQINAYPVDLKYLKATLRNYQLFGCKYILNQKCVLLGDEMGLGKTVTAIGAMSALKAEGENHFMVVCPASVLVNWCREVEQHSHLKAVKIHGNDEQAISEWIANGGVGITTYESISKFTLPDNFKISMLTVDEAHYVKNPDTIRTKAMKVLTQKTERILFMTGTPLENRVEEMCFLISMLNKPLSDELSGMKHLSSAQKFKEKLAPLYLRRTREDVLKELPELIEKTQWCSLESEEASKYRKNVLDGNFMAMRQVSWEVDDLSNSSKAKRLIELCNSAVADNRKIIIFSFFRKTIAKVCDLLGDICLEPITGSVSPNRRQEILDEFKNDKNKSVLVAQIQAGGTGLNIQTASVVIFCEPQIKPSLETQAISRAYRMGQLRSVLVHRLLADDTVDERITEILKEKQNLFDKFADESLIGEEDIKLSEAQMSADIIKSEQERLQIQETDKTEEQ